jgi:hypothetical protein
MMRDKYVIKANFSVPIMCFEILGGGGDFENPQ